MYKTRVREDGNREAWLRMHQRGLRWRGRYPTSLMSKLLVWFQVVTFTSNQGSCHPIPNITSGYHVIWQDGEKFHWLSSSECITPSSTINNPATNKTSLTTANLISSEILPILICQDRGPRFLDSCEVVIVPFTS